MSDPDALQARSVGFSYGNQVVLHNVTIELRRGAMMAVVGPNGSGKTTLLRIMSGVQRPSKGTVLLDGKSMYSMGRRTVARRIAVVTQHLDPSLAFSVREIVALGRAPYFGPLGTLSQADRESVESAMAATEVEALGSQRFTELSGGEQQRALLAAALAQETDYLLLDEPTVHLDLQHQAQLLDLLRTLRNSRGVGILAVLHDINAAALYFEQIAVLHRGRLVNHGSTSHVLKQADGLDAFSTSLHVIEHPAAKVPQVLLDRNEDS